MFRELRPGEFHEGSHPRRATKIRMGQHPQACIELRQKITDPDQIWHSIAQKTGQQGRANALTRQFQHAMGRIRPGDNSSGIDIGFDPSPRRSRPHAATKSDESNKFHRLRAERGGHLVSAIDGPSPSADSPSNQGFRRVVGQADRDVRVATRQVQHLIGKDQRDHHAWMLGPEFGHDPWHQVQTDRSGDRDRQLARRLDVSPRHPTLEFLELIRPWWLPARSFLRPPPSARILSGSARKTGADRRLHRSQPSKNSRMIDAKNLGRPNQRTGFRDRLDQSKFVPAKS